MARTPAPQPDGAGRPLTPRSTGAERASVLGGVALAVPVTAVSLLLDADGGVIGILWLFAIAWTVIASVAAALQCGVAHGDWSASAAAGPGTLVAATSVFPIPMRKASTGTPGRARSRTCGSARSASACWGTTAATTAVYDALTATALRGVRVAPGVAPSHRLKATHSLLHHHAHAPAGLQSAEARATDHAARYEHVRPAVVRNHEAVSPGVVVKLDPARTLLDRPGRLGAVPPSLKPFPVWPVATRRLGYGRNRDRGG